MSENTSPYSRSYKAAWDAGFSAAQSNIPKSPNPKRGMMSYAWDEGYDAAKNGKTRTIKTLCNAGTRTRRRVNG